MNGLDPAILRRFVASVQLVTTVYGSIAEIHLDGANKSLTTCKRVFCRMSRSTHHSEHELLLLVSWVLLIV